MLQLAGRATATVPTPPSGSVVFFIDSSNGNVSAKKSDGSVVAQIGAAGATGAQGPQGPQGVAGPAGPAGLTFRGSWASGTAYAINDAVAYQGSTFFATAAHTTSDTTPPTSNAPSAVTTANAGWAILSIEGATGPQGPQGIQGPAGTTAGGTRQIKSAAYTLAANDNFAYVSGTTTITLPTAATAAVIAYYIKNTGTGVVTVVTQGTETLDGAASIALQPKDALATSSDGTNWWII